MNRRRRSCCPLQLSTHAAPCNGQLHQVCMYSQVISVHVGAAGLEPHDLLLVGHHGSSAVLTGDIRVAHVESVSSDVECFAGRQPWRWARSVGHRSRPAEPDDERVLYARVVVRVLPEPCDERILERWLTGDGNRRVPISRGVVGRDHQHQGAGWSGDGERANWRPQPGASWPGSSRPLCCFRTLHCRCHLVAPFGNRMRRPYEDAGHSTSEVPRKLGTECSAGVRLRIRREALGSRPRRDLRACAESELGEDVLHVTLGGAFRDHERIGDPGSRRRTQPAPRPPASRLVRPPGRPASARLPRAAGCRAASAAMPRVSQRCSARV